MAFLSWFRRKPTEEDYEQVLASLALSIQTRQTKLSEIRLRERRTTLLATTWAFAGWISYVGVWVLGRGRGIAGPWSAPVILGPVAILFTRRIIQLWYTRKGNAEEETLRMLLIQQRNKIEEIKKKTNYYTTKNLLERYDDRPAQRSNVGEGSAVQKRGMVVSTPSQVAPTTPVQAQKQAPQTPSVEQNASFLSLPAPRKQWYDKLADAILGDDTASTGSSPTSRFALLCERCLSHNGLVKEEHWEDTQYICPKCGHFNPSARVRKAGAKSLATPTSPQLATTPPRVQGLSPSSVSDSNSARPSPSSTTTMQSQSALAQHETSLKEPLSSSTVLIEARDAEDEDRSRDEIVLKAEHDEKAGTTVRMEIDT